MPTIIRVKKPDFNGIDKFLKENNGVRISDERMLGYLSSLEGYNENRGEWFFFNIDNKRLELAKYMMIEENALVKIQGTNEDDIENKWESLRKEHPEKAVHVTDYAITQAARGDPLVLVVDYCKVSSGLNLGGLDMSRSAACVAYEKQV